jgi:hypothetical protein
VSNTEALCIIGNEMRDKGINFRTDGLGIEGLVLLEAADEIKRLRTALEQGAKWFREYEASHTAKGDTDKAKRNAERAATLEAEGVVYTHCNKKRLTTTPS